MSRNIAEKRVERKRKLGNRKRRIQYRLRDINWEPQDRPMFTAGNIHYELADRVRGLASGGIGAIHLLARKTGLVDKINVVAMISSVVLLGLLKGWQDATETVIIAFPWWVVLGTAWTYVVGICFRPSLTLQRKVAMNS